MRYRKRGSPRRSRYVIVLVGLSLVALLLPDSWTGGLISLVQVIVPVQHAATAAGDALEHLLGGGGPPVSAEQYREVALRKEALEHQVAALAVRAADLERQVALLTATRTWEVRGRGIGDSGRLIPAKVITDDLLTWRTSRLINKGSLRGVRRGAPVTSRRFTIDQGADAGVRNGMAVLLQEVLIGVVKQVGTHTARVQLISDITAGMKVRIGRFTEDGFVPLDQYFWLTGSGRDVMQIRDVERRDIEAGRIQVGDMVLADPVRDMLPAALTIGRVTRIAPDPQNPLLSTLTVRAAFDAGSLRRVYVYDPEAAGAAGGDNPR